MYFKPLRLSKPNPDLTEMPPLGMDAASIVADFRRHFNFTLGRDRHCKSTHYPYQALALTVRDRLMERWKSTRYAYEESDCRRAYYMSMEFLIGRSYSNAALNLDVQDEVSKAMRELGLNLEELVETEHDAGLGNGGLGRLAACFLDSCATLQLPVMGYGIRYEYGMFRQEIINGHQVEEPDHWLRDGYAWELERPEYTQRVPFGGRSEAYQDADGNQRMRWVGSHDVIAVPYDVPVPGFKNGTVNTLRLWSADATDRFDLGEFNAGDYADSVASKNAAENITMVLYPNDASENGKELRLRQQFFLASASLQDVLHRWRRQHGHDFSQFAERNCFQLNDTHPTCAIPELMRLLMDQHGLGWEAAWNITSRTMAYTNHTLLPEALERWPVRLFEKLLPRLLEIVYEINARFLDQVAQRWPGDSARQARMSIIEEGPEPQVRMAYLALVASFSVNGVAALHTELLKAGLFNDFHELWPDKFNNKTNGVTPRRWLVSCNPGLTDLLTETIGEGWQADLHQLRRLYPWVENAEFRDRWRAVRQSNKSRLAERVFAETGVRFPVDALFDVQVKRIHEYKRQLLNILHVIHLYARIKRGDTEGLVPRAVLLGGKAAPGYAIAKLIIKLINNVAAVVNFDTAVGDWLRVAFIPDYRVSLMELICPGTDLSEQVSTAGKEASGTGNMKFMMNGSLTIGTLDGANIEIREAVGPENFFLFGLTAQQVAETRASYQPEAIIAADSDLDEVMHLLQCGHFNRYHPGQFDAIIRAIRDPNDPWLVAADFRDYINAQRRVDQAYSDPEHWTRMSIMNTAASGRFSTDRTIYEYNQDIWKLPTVVASGVRS